VPRAAFEVAIEVSGTSLSLVACPTTDANASTGEYLFEGKSVFHKAGARSSWEEIRTSSAPATPGDPFAGTSLVEFSPTDRLKETIEVVIKRTWKLHRARDGSPSRRGRAARWAALPFEDQSLYAEAIGS
jgi:hypothetical protein